MRTAYGWLLALSLCVPVALLGQAAQAPQQQSQSGRAELNQIREAGYNAGFRDGVTDYRNQARYNFQNQPVYESGTLGYSPSSGVSQQTYKMNFRSGFEAGYDDDFYGRTRNAGAQPERSYSGEPSARVGSQAAANPAANQRTAGTIPAGTTLSLKLNNTLSTRSSQPGDTFTATVSQPVVGSGGRTVLVPEGSTVEGRVASVVSSGSVSGTSRIQLQFQQLRLPDGASFPLQAQLSGINEKSGVGGVITGTPSATNEGGVTQSKTRRTVGTAAAGGAVGALIGAIAGGGKAAGIGGLIGAGLGVVLSSTHGALDLPAGTPITITLSQPLQLGQR